MVRAKRVRSSTVILGGPLVRIADRCISLDTYTAMLDTNEEYVYARLRTRREITQQDCRQATKALTCGRIIAAGVAQRREYERTDYCRCTRFCRCCRAIAARARAEGQVNHEMTANNGFKLLSFVFTLPEPTSEQHSRELLCKANQAVKPALRSAITTWAKLPGCRHRIGAYVIGAHSKLTVHSPWLWSHVHLAIFVHPSCPLKKSGGILPYLRFAFEHVLDLENPVIKLKSRGRLTTRHRSDQQSQRAHRPKTCSYEYARNLFAYVIRTDERGESVETAAERDQLLDDLGSSAWPTRSRAAGGASKRKSLPHRFDPVKLGKPHIISYPLDGIVRRDLTPKQYHAESQLHRQQAESRITNLLANIAR